MLKLKLPLAAAEPLASSLSTPSPQLSLRIRFVVDVSDLDGLSGPSAVAAALQIAGRLLASEWLRREVLGEEGAWGARCGALVAEVVPIGFGLTRTSDASRGAAVASVPLVLPPAVAERFAAMPNGKLSVRLLPPSSPFHASLAAKGKGIEALALAAAWAFIRDSRSHSDDGTATTASASTSASGGGGAAGQSWLVFASRSSSFAEAAATAARGWWAFGGGVGNGRVVSALACVLGDGEAGIEDGGGGSPLQIGWRAPLYELSPASSSCGYTSSTAASRSHRWRPSADSFSFSTSSSSHHQLCIAVDCAQFAENQTGGDGSAPPAPTSALVRTRGAGAAVEKAVAQIVEAVRSELAASPVNNEGGHHDDGDGDEVDVTVDVALFDTVDPRGNRVPPALKAFEERLADLRPIATGGGTFVTLRPVRRLSRLCLATPQQQRRTQSHFRQATADTDLMCYLADVLLYPITSAAFPSVHADADADADADASPSCPLRQHFVLVSGDGDFAECVRFLLSEDGGFTISDGRVVPCARTGTVVHQRSSASGAWADIRHGLTRVSI